jgi:HEPN domain-containing protein
MVERSGDWIAQALRDLDNAKYEMAGEFYEGTCFLCQQSAEKAVKAVYQKMGAEAFGHSVAGLLSRLPIEKELSDKGERSQLVSFAKELDKAYILARYPNSHPEGAPYTAYTATEAERSINYAERIVRFCENSLSKV